MITQNKQTVQYKSYQSALRHKVRNLRAKVRLLLPVDICCKYEKRNKNLMKMQHEKYAHNVNCTRNWSHSKYKSTQLFYPTQQLKSQAHLFYKLSPAQIQQIKEDKLYYVGEQFISQFDTYIERRDKSANKPGRNINLMQNNILNATNRNLTIPEIRLKYRVSNFSQTFKLDIPKQEDKRMKRMIRTQKNKAKHRMLTQQDVTKKVVIKMKRRQKQQQQHINFQRIKDEQQQTIKAKNKLIRIKTETSMSKRINNQMETGQIHQLCHRLRQICLNRSSKSANRQTN